MYISEYYGSTLNGVAKYREDDSNMLVQNAESKRHHSVKCFLQDVFLPKGYPGSVSKDYLEYQIWDTAQAFCSSITRTLATHAVLKGSGVGDAAATAAAATITWLLKDGTGMTGRIAFAYFYGTSLDSNCKQWRLFADVLNDCAICVELLAPALPKSYFTPIMCASGLAYSLVGVAGGCTRAALTLHQAKRNNMADVSAKDGSQETLVNLAALVTSLLITPLVAGHAILTWFLFVAFSMMHIYSNYRAVSCVVMETFNRLRFEKAFLSFISNKALTPEEVNSSEPIVRPHSFPWLRLGCKLEDLNITYEEFNSKIHKNDSNHKFIVKCNQQTGIIYAALESTATSKDIIFACYECFLLRWNVTSPMKNGHDFLEMMKSKGWNVDVQHLCADEWRWSLQETLHAEEHTKQKVV